MLCVYSQNVPEAVALLSSQVMELAREGHSVAEIMSTGRSILGKRQVIPGRLKRYG